MDIASLSSEGRLALLGVLGESPCEPTTMPLTTGGGEELDRRLDD